MTERERFLRTLDRLPVPGRVPTYEQVFFLTLEAFGRVHPLQRQFAQWGQMSPAERDRHARDMAEIYIAVARRYHHSAMFVHVDYGTDRIVDWPRLRRVLEYIRELSGLEFAVLLHGDPTFAIPTGETMTDFATRMYEDADSLKRETMTLLLEYEDLTRRLHGTGLVDGFVLCSDYCFNAAPFYTDDMFNDLVAPYLARIISTYRDLGFYTIKHSDGNLNPLLEAIVQCRPHAIHSLDPQGGVSLAAVSARYGDRVALCGNVNCGLLQTGTPEQVADDARRSLREGMARGRGYVFCTSNCAYTGLDLARYELMNRTWYEEGIYA
ncbi:MAG: uroporphyrinogen decarboxylase family protein [Verrucomicrobiales bacterium]|jgi:uroporphyrinogen decarboxylase|nr:uroporphyrinogen decarboxylase family protein [Verrucomicrobiales bacterium]